MTAGMIIKVCGMRESENILSIDALGIDLMGFIFYPKSPRYVDALPDEMPKLARRVGVFVNENIETICQRIAEFELDYVQLHGSESAEFCGEVAKKGVKIIKAFSVDESFDFGVTDNYINHCDIFVFDTKCKGYGGSGEQFDWSLLNEYNGSTPFLLSGGITVDNLDGLKSFDHPQLVGYDLNSRFETEPALKSREMLNIFLEQLSEE
ncbi:MAG: phosphoribosylanthranilate isomerase [Rikenellaceae bacterium]